MLFHGSLENGIHIWWKKFISARISYGKEEALNDMIINWSLSLVNEIVDKLWK